MTRSTENAAVRGREGSILIEVVIAVVLLAILVAPLAGGITVAAARADAVRQQAGRIADGVSADDALLTWGWGTKVARAWWIPGPTLCVRSAPRGDQAARIGVWVDGWFLREDSLDEDGLVRLGPATWLTRAGGELVLRARTPGGVWGPPWRSIVPGVEGVVSLPVTTEAPAVADGQVVAHASAAGNPAFQLSWEEVSPEPGPLGLPLVVQTALSGPCGIGLDGWAQCWRAERQRDLDVYF
jgi:hypothetical protein